MRESHIDIDAGIGHYHIKNELQNKGLDRNILIRLPSYLGWDWSFRKQMLLPLCHII